jgi:hypothetical protein
MVELERKEFLHQPATPAKASFAGVAGWWRRKVYNRSLKA